MCGGGVTHAECWGGEDGNCCGMIGERLVEALGYVVGGDAGRGRGEEDKRCRRVVDKGNGEEVVDVKGKKENGKVLDKMGLVKEGIRCMSNFVDLSIRGSKAKAKCMKRMEMV